MSRSLGRLIKQEKIGGLEHKCERSARELSRLQRGFDGLIELPPVTETSPP